MTENDELLPCPFCGGPARPMMGFVGCEPCALVRRDAESWNRRAPGAQRIRDERGRLRKALKFYADREHFIVSDDNAWDTVSGEPPNYWCDEAGTATVEDGSIARAALSGAKK